ncbi:MAG: tetratricopeptide repeat protein [Chloroflexota bacterium]
MAKKRRTKAQKRRKTQQQQQSRPSNRIKQAVDSLKHNKVDEAVTLARQALRGANDDQTKEKAKVVLAESNFRLAAKQTDLTKRLDALDAALKVDSTSARFHLHRGQTLLQLGRLDEALKAFDQLGKVGNANVVDGDILARIDYIRQLTTLVNDRVDSGKKSSAAKTTLSPKETNTLKLIQEVHASDRKLTPLKKTEQWLAKLGKDSVAGPSIAVWTHLIDMYGRPKSSPLIELQQAILTDQEIDADTGKRPNAILNYYLGIAAMRKGERAVAQTAWLQANQQGLSTAWFVDNRMNQMRESIVASAQNEHWREVIRQTNKLNEDDVAADKVLSETVGVAYENLGYASAQKGDWQRAARQWREATKTIGRRQLIQNLAMAEEKLSNWEDAALSWRDMVKRRPRKKDHPNYLSDTQVAAIWQHAATCYEQLDYYDDDVITCLKNALKYASDNTEIRLHLATVYMGAEREEAAINELNRLLEIDPNHVKALLRLGALYQGQWGRDDMEIWRRVLKLEPGNMDARQALAESYVRKAEQRTMFAFFGMSEDRIKETIKMLERGLRELPGHPTLLMNLGQYYAMIDRDGRACSYYRQAWEAAPQEVTVLGPAIQGLLTADGGEIIRELLPSLRNPNSNLVPAFWIHHVKLLTEIDTEDVEIDIEEWVQVFADEALMLARQQIESGKERQSVVSILVELFELTWDEDLDDLAEAYEQQIAQEAKDSGAVEYIEAYKEYTMDDNDAAKRWLKKAQNKAKKANDKSLISMMERLKFLMESGGGMGGLFNLFGRLGGLGGLEPDLDDDDIDLAPDALFGSLMEVLEEMDEEEINEFRRLL